MISFNATPWLSEDGLSDFSALQHEADGLSAGLPPLMVEADHLAASVSLGVHGRRRAGVGENFWQFRRYASRLGGRHRLAAIGKSQHIFVREREWEAAQTVWFWRDASANMAFKSGAVSKRTRADLLLLALASLLVRGGERVGFVGMDGGAGASRLTLTRIGRALFPKATPRCRRVPRSRVATNWSGSAISSPTAWWKPCAIFRAGAYRAIWCASSIRRKKTSLCWPHPL